MGGGFSPLALFLPPMTYTDITNWQGHELQEGDFKWFMVRDWTEWKIMKTTKVSYSKFLPSAVAG